MYKVNSLIGHLLFFVKLKVLIIDNSCIIDWLAYLLMSLALFLLIHRNVFVRFAEIPAMAFQDIM